MNQRQDLDRPVLLNPAIRGVLLLTGVAAWGAMLFGSLQLHRNEALGEAIGHGVCGPWGCAARPEALLGYHAFWLTLLGPAGLLAGLALMPQAGRAAWRTVFGIGVGLTLLVAGWAIFDCLVNGPENLRRYWLQIAGFRLATNTDLPAVQVALAGLACWAGVTVRRLLGREPTKPDALADRAPLSPAAAAGSPAAP